MKYSVLFLGVLITSLVSATHAQRLSYSISTSRSAQGITTALVVSNIVPLEGLIPRLLPELRGFGYDLAMVKGEINTMGMNKTNSPFAPEIVRVLEINVLNTTITETIAKMELSLLNLENGVRKNRMIAMPKENYKFIAAEIAKFLAEEDPSKKDPLITAVSMTEARIPLQDFPGLKKGDVLTVRFEEPRQNMSEAKVEVARLEQATNSDGVFEMFAILSHKQTPIKEGDRVLRIQPTRHRFSLSLMGTVSIFRSNPMAVVFNGQTYTGLTLWGGGFILQGEYERLLPYNFTSTTAFGLNVDPSLNTFIMTGIGWRYRRNSWELIPSFRIGIAYTPLSFQLNEQFLQGSSIRFGIDAGVSFLYHMGPTFSLGFDVGVQYWFYSLGLLYEETTQVRPTYPSGQVPLAYLYPRFGLKFAWAF
ncbi:MAG: hypothetical protein ACRCY4_01760 [Brevinema sp.]